MKTETAKKAAKWWADHLRNGCKQDNGDCSEVGAMTMAFGLLLQHALVSKITPGQIDSFEAHLTARFEAMPDTTYGVRAGDIDYHPCRDLSAAAMAAGIDVDGALPIKSSVVVHGDVVTVYYGYCAAGEVLP